MTNNSWNGNNRRKYLLQYHVIFVCKYRKKLLDSPRIASDIKRLSEEICEKHHILIRYMETDKDHIHYMIETDTTKSLSDIIKLMSVKKSSKNTSKIKDRWQILLDYSPSI